MARLFADLAWRRGVLSKGWFGPALIGLAVAACGVPNATNVPAPSTIRSIPPVATPTPVPVPSAAIAAPDGWVAFLRGAPGSEPQDVFVVRSDGTGLTPVTHDEIEEADVRWLLDGSRLVFTWSTAKDPYHDHVVSIRPDGSDRVELGIVQTVYHDPAVSPDGTRVAYSGDGTESGASGISILDLRDGTLVQLTRDGATGASWSPDGTRLLAVLPSRRLLVIDAASGERLTDIADASIQEAVGWTPDGSILYHGCTARMTKPECMANPTIVADPDGSNARPYTGGVAEVEGVPSPDGRWRALSRDGVVYVRSTAENAPEVRVADGFAPAWSPDSAWLVFSQAVAAAGPSGQAVPVRLVVARVAGGVAIPLTQGALDLRPVWQPSAG